MGAVPFWDTVSSRALMDWKYLPACPVPRTKTHKSLCLYYHLVALRCPQLMSLKTKWTDTGVFLSGPSRYLMQLETQRAAGCCMAAFPYLDTRGNDHCPWLGMLLEFCILPLGAATSLTNKVLGPGCGQGKLGFKDAWASWYFQNTRETHPKGV